MLVDPPSMREYGQLVSTSVTSFFSPHPSSLARRQCRRSSGSRLLGVLNQKSSGRFVNQDRAFVYPECTDCQNADAEQSYLQPFHSLHPFQELQAPLPSSFLHRLVVDRAKPCILSRSRTGHIFPEHSRMVSDMLICTVISLSLVVSIGSGRIPLRIGLDRRAVRSCSRSAGRLCFEFHPDPR